MRTVIVLGHDGYIGHALTMRLLTKGYKVVGIDNWLRRQAVKDMDSFSATPIETPYERAKSLRELGDFSYYGGDISTATGYHLLKSMITQRKPMAVVNLAQMPSAPYSQKSVRLARLTAINNIASTVNVLWAMKDSDAQLVQIGTMGEYDPAIGMDIPEGNFQMPMNVDNQTEKSVIFPRKGGSFYHTSKISATYFIEFASRVYNIRATDIMQGIVYGNWTPEIENTNLHTRLDSDEAFGTVVNRFIVQSVLEYPLTVYGKGEHKRGFLALNDSVQCLMLAIENSDYEGYRVWNQLDTVHSMLEVAHMIKDTARNHHLGSLIQMIDTPRVEVTDDFYYKPVVEKLKALGFEPTRSIEDEADYVKPILKKHSFTISRLSKVVMPKITWR